MATYKFSALADGQTIRFDPSTDVLEFDDPAVSATSLSVSYWSGDTFLSYWDGSTFSKWIQLEGAQPVEMSSANLRFADGSRMLFGDNSAARNDWGPNTLVGGAGDDHLMGFDGSDRLDGGAGNDWLDGGEGEPVVFAGAGDLDGDGRSDILWRDLASGDNIAYRMQGTSVPRGPELLRSVEDGNWSIAAVADFDGDGKDDIFWRNYASFENYLWTMDGVQVTAGEGYVRTVAPHWDVAGAGDFDGDGKADLFWRNWQSGENYIYFMDGKAIKPTEGYTRTVADGNWRMTG